MDFLRSAAELKEHFRALTTICDAFIKPAVNRQTRSISKRLQDDNVGANIVVCISLEGESLRKRKPPPQLDQRRKQRKESDMTSIRQPQTTAALLSAI
jgi:hypothetical protein